MHAKKIGKFKSSLLYGSSSLSLSSVEEEVIANELFRRCRLLGEQREKIRENDISAKATI